MSRITGQVQEIIINSDKAQPDRFNPEKMSCGCSITVNGERYSTFLKSDNFGNFKLKTGQAGGYALIEIGDEVSFEITENGQYKNFKPATMLIVTKGTGDVKPADSPFKPAQQVVAEKRAVTQTSTAKAQADSDRQLAIEIQSSRRDATELVCALTKVDGAIKKATLKDPDAMVKLIGHYTVELYKTRLEIAKDPTGEALFNTVIDNDEEAK